MLTSSTDTVVACKCSTCLRVYANSIICFRTVNDFVLRLERLDDKKVTKDLQVGCLVSPVSPSYPIDYGLHYPTATNWLLIADYRDSHLNIVSFFHSSIDFWFYSVCLCIALCVTIGSFRVAFNGHLEHSSYGSKWTMNFFILRLANSIRKVWVDASVTPKIPVEPVEPENSL